MARNRLRRRLSAFLVALTLAGLGYFFREPIREAATTQRVEGQVTRVIDGDTFEMIYKGDPDKVRIANIDAWEKSDPGGPAATAYLKRRIDGQVVMLKTSRSRMRDRYGRILARVYLEDVDIGEEMIARGHARPWQQKDGNR